MPRTYEGELSAKMAVLGLVAERPGETGSKIAERLRQRFAYTRWSKSAANNALPQLLKQGSVRCVYEAPGHERSFDRYEATDRGIVELREWVRASSKAPIALREALYGRIEFAGLADLPALIENLRVEYDICKEVFVEGRTRLHVVEAQITRQGASWRESEVQAALLADQCSIWWARMTRLKRLSRRLQAILDHAERDAVGG